MSSSSQEEYFVIVCKDGKWKSENGESVYERPFVKNFGMDFPIHITKCDDLVNYIKVKAGYTNEANVSLSFQHPEKKYVIDIVDEGDVRRLKKIIKKATDTIYLYLVANEEVEEGPSQVKYNAFDRLNVVANRASGNKRGKGSAEKRSSGRGSNNPPTGFMSPNNVPFVTQLEPAVYNNQYTYQQINYGNHENHPHYLHQNPPEYTSQFPPQYPTEYTSQYPPQCHPQYHVGYSSYPTPMLPYGTPMLPYGMQMLPYPTSTFQYPTTVEPQLDYEQRYEDHIVLHEAQVHDEHVIQTQNVEQHVQDTGICTDYEQHVHDTGIRTNVEQHVQDVGNIVDTNYEATAEGGSDFDDKKSNFSEGGEESDQGGEESDQDEDYLPVEGSSSEDSSSEGGSDYDNYDASIEVSPFFDDPFFGMPQIPECPQHAISTAASKSLNPYDSITKGKCFDTKEQLQVALGIKTLLHGVQYKTIRSSNERFQAKCHHDGCSWSISAAPVMRGSYWQVKKLNDEHTCTSVQLNPNHKQGNKKVLGHLVATLLQGDHGRIYRPQDIQQDISTKYNISISYKQAWRAKEYALSLLRGSDDESFARLPLYCHYLKQSNPGTVTHIQTDDEDRFEFLFVAIGVAVICYYTLCA